ncbi:hypothetical protein ACVIHH_008213 [Bradyrhizobium sp. USDA 4518]|nr:hypothetical protein [Bradyrhizobium sp. USDA 4545]MCP1920443.1 hypothetical protein [Bradyrhizobium sp. USDA 4532]
MGSVRENALEADGLIEPKCEDLGLPLADTLKERIVHSADAVD